MGDAEDALPPSKKRAAGRELTRDTPIDDEEDASELETGTFKKASDEVLATRRIVKVRRQQTNSAPASNPFAGIRLVAPTESSANSAAATTEAQSASGIAFVEETKGSDGTMKDSDKAKDEDSKTLESNTVEAKEKANGNKDAAVESTPDKEPSAEESADGKSGADKEQSKDGKGNEDEIKNDTAEKSTKKNDIEADKEQSKDDKDNDSEAEIKNDTAEKSTKKNDSEADKEQSKDDKDNEHVDKKESSDNEDKKAEKAGGEESSAEGAPLKSFQQLSSSQNAFSGLAGTGFSTSSFSFGSVSSGGSAFGSGSGSIFGMKNDKAFDLGLSNNGSSAFGASGSSAVSKSEGSGFSTLQEIETGEENERVVFNADSVLFEFVDGSWKERGKGELKVNITLSGEEKARLLMRSRGNYRLILNARLYPDMKLTNMDKKGVTFACINSAYEGKGGLSTFALKFKDGSIVEEFRAAVTAHKGKTPTATPLKTPENSPKASDD